MSYDLIVIGTGPGGYVCAIRAAQLGLKTAVVEKWPTQGGTCLNVGCIPSKALLHASEMFETAQHDFPALGISGCVPELDLPAMMRHKSETVSANVNGVAFLLKKNKIDVYTGEGSIPSPGCVKVTTADGNVTDLETKNIVIATGSEVTPLPGVEIDEKCVVSSTGALSLPEVPGKLLVIGAGVIGLELGSVWRRLGAEVEVVEYLDHILPGMDGEISTAFLKTMKKQGVDFHLGSKVVKVEPATLPDERALNIHVEPAQGGELRVLNADVVLVAIGRRPYTQGLGLEALGVNMERGRVQVDDGYKTNLSGIYAIGDVIRGPMLAHKAEDEGIAVAEILAGQHGHVNYNVIPGVVYTSPEIASVGQTEAALKEANVPYTVGRFPFTANGRARAMRHTDGFVKVLSHAQTDRVLGVHIIGHGAGEMIAEACVLMEFGGSAEDLARTCHAHPTMSEAVKEAAMAVAQRAIHM